MPHIILDEEQAKILSESTGEIEIRDAAGRHLGYAMHGFSAEDVVGAKQRADSTGPWHSTGDVLDRLRSLEQA